MTEEAQRGQVITFYSYKGGTGRSMALANVACLLATEQAAKGGKPVLAIDWDLEAPGLHRYFETFLHGRGDAQDGLIEMFEELRSRVRPGCAPDEEEEMSAEVVGALDLVRFAVPTSYPKLWFLRAGRFDDTYSTRTNTFQWPELYGTAPSLFRMLAERLAETFSYVLIDSRTGITDTSGICTTLMPEKLVLVFTPNRQSLTGITELVKRAYAYRRGSDDVRPLIVYPLPSRIETSLPDEMKRWRLGDERDGIVGWEKQFTDLLRGVYELPESFSLERYFDAVQAQHVPPYAFGEPIAVLRERGSERLTLTKSYDTFRGYLVRSAPWDEQVSEVDEATRQATLEQLNRLNEEFRVATEAVRPAPQAASLPVAPLSASRDAVSEAAERVRGRRGPRLRSSMVKRAVEVSRHSWFFPLMFAAMVLLTVPLVLRFYKPSSGAGTRLALVISDAEENRPSTTLLLLAALMDDLSAGDRKIAEEQLSARLARMGAPMLRIPVEATPASMSLAGTHLAIVAVDGTLRRFDVAKGKAFPAIPGTYAAAAERPDGTTVAVTEEGVLAVYENGAVTARHELKKRGFFHFGPNGRMLIHATPGGDATVWALEKTVPVPVYGVQSVERSMAAGSFSGDGESIVVTTPTSTVLVGARRHVELPLTKPRTIVVDESGTRVALVSGGRTAVYDAGAGKELSILPAMPTLTISADGETLMGLIPVNTVARFDARTGEQISVLPYTNREVRGLDFLEDGRVVTTFTDRVDVGQPLAARDLLIIEPGERIRATVIDGMTIVVAGDTSLTAWSLEGEPVDPIATAEELVAEVCRRVGRDLTDQEWSTYFGSARKEQVCKKRQENASK